MSLTKWELELDSLTKQLTLTFDNVVKVSTDMRAGEFIVRVDMTGGRFSETEKRLTQGKLDAGRG